jgi:hypothetical protein
MAAVGHVSGDELARWSRRASAPVAANPATTRTWRDRLTLRSWNDTGRSSF